MSTSNGLQLAGIVEALADQRPATFSPADRSHAAVAMILREGATSPEMLFIIRAEHEQDPWSGNIGFPGGRLDKNGETPQQAAERETFEELAVDLSQGRCIGRLDDIYGTVLPVLVSCFVYQLQQPAKLQPNHEVARAFWCPFARLLEPHRQQYRTFRYRGTERTQPVVELLEPHEPLLWGITYRLIRNLFTWCNQEFGPPAQPSQPH